jgi:hypothetical protein
VRNLLILVLGGVIVWLLIDRNRLNEELAAAKSELATAQEQLAPVKPGQHGRPNAARGTAGGNRGGSWLDEHIERGAKILSAPPK